MKSELIERGLLWGASVALAAVLAGCSGGDAEGAGSGPPLEKGPTYYRDVKAILDVKCTGCHFQGGIAPFALTSYMDAKTHKDAINAAVTQGVMPPWPPA